MGVVRSRAFLAVAGIAAVGLLATACGSKASTTDGTSASAGGGTSATGGGASGAGSSSAATTSDFKACMVTDTGGIDDKSFNASAWAGMQAAQAAGKAQVSYVQSQTEADYTTNISKLLSQKCKLIVTVGGLMGEATGNAAKANPSQHFAEVDNPGNKSNWQGLQFNAAHGGFLGGYLAAGYSKTGKVATYGGLQIAPVTVYMDGFYEGVQYYNQTKGKNVQVLGWNEARQKGSFAGSFTDQTKGQQLASNFMSSGADVIFPVAGGVGIGTASTVKASNGKAVVIWVDSDGCVSAAQYCSVFLSTVYKNVQGAVQKAVTDDSSGTFDTTDYIGTVANGGTGLSPFHDFASKVDPTLQTELKQVQADIVSGKITIKSKSQPTS